MTNLYVEPIGGIAGDMMAGALLDLGVPLELFKKNLALLNWEGVELSTKREKRGEIFGFRFLVSQKKTNKARAFSDIQKLFEEAALPPKVLSLALRIFTKLAQAEAKVHGCAPSEVHFHEVGGYDSIADILSIATGLAELGVENIYSSLVPTGKGWVNTEHGRMPLPAPATLLLLQGFPITQGGEDHEQTTPTGAAFLAALAQPLPQGQTWIPQKVGIGIGTKNPKAYPNILRLTLATQTLDPKEEETSKNPWKEEWVEEARANIDDASPELLGHLMEKLFQEGALDVAFVPLWMKNNRPASQLQFIYPKEKRDRLHALLFAESSTLGLRHQPLCRSVLPRQKGQVHTHLGEVEGKISSLGQTKRFFPEYKSCHALAKTSGKPLQEIYLLAQKAFLQENKPS